MNKQRILLGLTIAAMVAFMVVDRLVVSKLEQRFLELEKQRIITSNKLTTSKIVSENLNHVRDLVFQNMDFQQQGYSQTREDQFFAFITGCVNDLKIKLVSMRPVAPRKEGRITTFGYHLELEGDFFKFGELCAKFENSRRIISVESFSVELKTDEEKEGIQRKYKTISVSMQVNTYWIGKGSSPT